MSNQEEAKIIECMQLLKQDGNNSKATVYDKLEKLIIDHRLKWNK